MFFSHPSALWLLFLVPIALLLGIAQLRYVQQIQQAFALPAATRRREIARMASGSLALLALIGALSGPRYWLLQKDDPRQHLKLAIGLDVSKSMLAEDIFSAPLPKASSPAANRLQASRLLVLRLIEELAGEEAGLFFFARNGLEVVAPTRDQGFLRYMVQHTRLAELTESGSDLKSAMAAGATLLGDRHSQTPGAIILISDGEDTENSLAELVGQAEQMKQDGLPVYTIGVGRREEVYIPIRRPGAAGIEGFYTDATGRHLRTGLQPDSLQSIASHSGGRYFALSGTTPEELSAQLLALIPQVAAPSAPLAKSRRLADLAPLLLTFGLALYTAHCIL